MSNDWEQYDYAIFQTGRAGIHRYPPAELRNEEARAWADTWVETWDKMSGKTGQFYVGFRTVSPWLTMSGLPISKEKA